MSGTPVRPLPSGRGQRMIPAAEFARRFGQIRDEAGAAPIWVTNHGRPTHVFLSTGQYEEIAAHSEASSLPAVTDLADWVQHGVLILDDDLNILLANDVAHALLLRPRGQIVGEPIFAALPEFEHSLFESHLRQAAASGERAMCDLASPVREGAWLRADFIPCARALTVLLRDVTRDIHTDAEADSNATIVAALRDHPHIGYLAVDARGRIEQANQGFLDWIALPETRIRGALAADLVLSAERAAFREALDQVLSTGRPATIDTRLLANAGDVLDVVCSIRSAEQRAAPRGAVIVLSRTAS